MTQIATTIEQSKKLLSLGIDPDTADIHYSVFNTKIPLCEKPFLFNGEDLVIPSWSLTALLKLMSEYTLQTTTDGRVFCVSENHITELYENPIDAAVEMIGWLVNNGYIEKEE